MVERTILMLFPHSGINFGRNFCLPGRRAKKTDEKASFITVTLLFGAEGERRRRTTIGINRKWVVVVARRYRGQVDGSSPPILQVQVFCNGEYCENDQNSKYHVDYAGGLRAGVRTFGYW